MAKAKMTRWARHALGWAVLAVAAGVVLFASGVLDLRSRAAAQPAPFAHVIDAALRGEIERLKADVARTPTNATNVLPRARTLWAWANALTRAGVPIHPELSSTVANIVSAAAGERLAAAAPRAQQINAAIDSWVREFALLEAQPDAVGKLAGVSTGPFEVDTYAELRQVYTVGARPLVKGDGLLVSSRAYGGDYDVQTTDPTADNYLRLIASDPGVRLQAETMPVSGMFSGRLGGVNLPRPLFRVVEGQLDPGETVTIVMGDRSGGGQGLRLPTTSSTGLRFRVWIHFGAEDVLMNLAEVPFVTVGGAAAGVRVLAPSVVKAGEAFSVTVRSEDQFRNRATGAVPAYELTAEGRTLATLPAGEQALQVVDGLKLNQPGIYWLKAASKDGRFSAESNPVLVERDPKTRVFWGETHGHSGFAEGMGTVDGYYAFARDDARLDFATLSEHDIWLDDGEWAELTAAGKSFNDPGRFHAFVGYEWTTQAAQGGHHNVIFRTPDRDRVGRQIAPTLADLHRELNARYQPNDVVVLPHAHQPGDWRLSDFGLEKFVEIVSNHGTFEWFGQAYLSQGWQVGFIGGSDDHIGHPGLRALSRTSGSDNRGGLAAIRAHHASNDAIFDAMRAQAGYATNGERIILETELVGHAGGLRAEATTPRRLRGRVIGTAPIERIAILKNGAEVFAEDFVEAKALGEVAEVVFFSDAKQPQWGEQSRGWRPWRGEIEVVGATLISVEAPKNENVFTEFARIAPDAPNKASFFLRTRGAPKGVVLRLSGVSANTRLIVRTQAVGQRTPAFERGFAAGELVGGAQTAISEDDGFQDSVSVRFANPPQARVRTFAFDDPGPAQPGDSYYVRVLQTNGGMAWSSPIWVGGAPRMAP